jgi:hypothetical protein
MQKLRFHEDTGHGWLEVAIARLKELGIENKITRYSYIDREKGLAYLEEDIDMSLIWVDGMEFEEVYSERSFIRDLERYTP